MLWYQQLRIWVIGPSLATWRVIMQGLRCIFHAFKPTAEELPISTRGSSTPKYESVSTDPEISLACRLYLATRASRMARFSMSFQPSPPLPDNPADDDASNDSYGTLGNVIDGISCTVQSRPTEESSSPTHFDLTSSSSYDSPSQYGTTPPTSPNLDPPLLIVSGPTEDDFKLSNFQDELDVTSDISYLGMGDEVEVEELISPELSSPEDAVVFQKIQAERLALVTYKPGITNAENHGVVAPVSIPLKLPTPCFREPLQHTHALRDSLLLSPPPFSLRRRPASGGLDRCRGPINTIAVKPLLVSRSTVATPIQSFVPPRLVARSTNQESEKLTSAHVGRVRDSATPKSSRHTSGTREAKCAPSSFQGTYENADAFSTHADSLFAPSFSPSDINNVGLYMVPESSTKTGRVEPGLRSNSHHDSRTEEIKVYEMQTILHGKPRSFKTKPWSKPWTDIEPSPAFESPPPSAPIVKSTSYSESVSSSFNEDKISIGNEMLIDEETGDIHSEPSFVDEPFLSDVHISTPDNVPPDDLYKFDISAPWRSWPSKAPCSWAEKLQRHSANVSICAAEVFPFSLDEDPLSFSSESDFSSTEEVPHIKAILDCLDLSPLQPPFFEPTLASIPVSISFLDLNSPLEHPSCGPSGFDSPTMIAPISVANYEAVPVPESIAPPAVAVESNSAAKLSVANVGEDFVSMPSDPVSLSSFVSSGNDTVGDFNVNMAPTVTPNGRRNGSLAVIQPGPSPAANHDREEPMFNSSPWTIQRGPPQNCPNLEPSSVIAVPSGLGPNKVPRSSRIAFTSVVEDDSRKPGVERLNQTATLTAEVASRFLQVESGSSRYPNLKDKDIRPLGRRVGIYRSIPRQRISSSPSLSDHSNQTRAIVLERHRASVLDSASHKRSGLQALRLPQLVALRELNTEVNTSILSAGSTPDTTMVSTFLDNAKEPPLSKADRNQISLDVLVAPIDSDMKTGSNSDKLNAPSFQMSSASIQWGVPF